MAQKKSSGRKEHTIKLNISLDDKTPEAKVISTKKPLKPESVFVNDSELLRLANLVVKSGEHNTEYGRVLVRVLEFREESQRKKVIRLLRENYPEIIWKLAPLLTLFGAHVRAEVRKRTAEAVGELMCEVDFNRVKNEILTPWALSDVMMVSLNVGVALNVAAQNPKYAENVKLLLKHWISLSNINYNWTALASCVPLCSLWPDEILGFVERSFSHGRLELLALTFFVTRELCKKGYANKVISHLSDWIRREKGEHAIRAGAAAIFLEVIEFSDIAGNGTLIDKVTEIFLAGLQDRSIDNAGIYRMLMLEKLKMWIESTEGKKSALNDAEKLFARLYRRSDARGRERLSFKLRRWSQTAEGKGAKIYERLLEIQTA